MPGLVGIVATATKAELDSLLAPMILALKHEDCHQVDRYTEDEIALARVSPGIVNPEPQPIWNEDKTVCIAMEGEVYDCDEEKQRLIERGHRFRVDNGPELVMHLYEQYGRDFALKLNGAFVAAIWDTRQHCLHLVNDRFGQRCLFYAQVNGRLLFASSVSALLATKAIKCDVDVVAMAEFLTFEHVLEDRTLLCHVKLMSPASVMSFQDGSLTHRCYWQLEFDESYGFHKKAWYVEQWTELICQATRRRMRDRSAPGIMLSGGMDSRAIIGAMHRVSDGSVKAFTFGVPNCDDARFAREVTRRLNVSHQFIELKPDYLLTLAAEGVGLTDGMNSCIHMHNRAIAREVRRSVQTVFTGNLGDDLMADRPRGGYSYRVLPTVQDWDTMAAMLFEIDNACVPLREQCSLFADDCYRRIDGVVQENHRAVLSRANTGQSANVLKYWEITQYNRRMTLQGQVLLLDQVAVRAPFYDNDLVEFMLNVPPALRLDGHLYTLALSAAFPELAKVPWSSTGLPLVPCLRYTQVQFAQQVRWRLLNAGLHFIAPPAKRPYANYDGWMRTALRPWVEETLLSKRALGRGYFNPDYIRNLVAEHMAGASHARELGALLTIELWHQLFLD